MAITFFAGFIYFIVRQLIWLWRLPWPGKVIVGIIGVSLYFFGPHLEPTPSPSWEEIRAGLAGRPVQPQLPAQTPTEKPRWTIGGNTQPSIQGTPTPSTMATPSTTPTRSVKLGTAYQVIKVRNNGVVIVKATNLNQTRTIIDSKLFCSVDRGSERPVSFTARNGGGRDQYLDRALDTVTLEYTIDGNVPLASDGTAYCVASSLN